MSEDTLPVDRMIRDADEAWSIFEEDMSTRDTHLLGEMACHVRALAQYIEQLRAENDLFRDALTYARQHVRHGHNDNCWWNDPRTWRVDHEIARALAGRTDWREDRNS